MTKSSDLANTLARQIFSGVLTSGSQVPSVRDMAVRARVSVSTAVAAYEVLLARGLIEARPRQGYFVRVQQPVLNGRVRTESAEGPTAKTFQPVDAASLLRGMFSTHAPRSAPGFGALPPDWLEPDLVHAAYRAVLKKDLKSRNSTSTNYGDPTGDKDFRSAIADMLGAWGIESNQGVLISANGATHALDIAARALLAPGDTVLVDEPGWPVEYARLRSLGLQILPVPRHSNGPDLEVMATLAKANKPKAYFCVTCLHNPTGWSMSAASAHKVLRLAESENFLVIEDDSYSWFAEQHAIRMSALDKFERTVYIGGFSKVLSPSIRVGFMVVPKMVADEIINAKILSCLTSASIAEQAVAEIVSNGGLARLAQRLRKRLEKARDRSVNEVLESGCTLAATPSGMFGWIDAKCNTRLLSEKLLQKGWLIAPGHLFYVDGRDSTLFRANFSTSEDPAMWSAIAVVRESLLT